MVQLTATNIPAAGLYVNGFNTTVGIASISLSNVGAVEDLNITFKSPASMAVGTYSDTITIKVCTDQACTQQISGSPLQIATVYNVTAGNPATATPTIASLSPSSAVVGSAGITLSIVGSNFASGSILLWNGLARATTYVSPTSISAQITAADLAVAGSAAITVSNTATGGGVSAAAVFTISPIAPAISALSPSTVSAGGSPFTLTVTGTGFDTFAQISWNGVVLPTTYVSATQLTATVPATDIASAGTYVVTVTNQDQPTLISNAASMVVNTLPLSLTGVSPSTVVAGGVGFVETVVGTGFNASSTVQWNGSPRPTTLVTTTELLAQITAADIASIGSASITVANGGATPGTSGAISLAITAAAIDAVAFQINAQHNGAINFANIIAPSAFPLTPTWTAALDGAPSYALIAGGKVFVTESLAASGTSELVAFNGATGAKLWGPIAIANSAAATYDNGTVFVLSATIGTPGLLAAYNASTGSLLWSTALTSQYWFTGPPTAGNGFVYEGGAGSGGTLYAVNETNGALAWTASVQNGDNSSPSVTADGVYVSYPCQSYDFRPLTGEQVWNANTGCSGGGGATGTVANGIDYSPNGITGFSGLSYNAETGAVVSSYSASVPPAIGAQMGYFLQTGTLRGITLANSTIQWSFAGDGSLNSPPILVNNYVFITGSSGNLYALDATTGSQLWQTNLGASTTYSYGNSVQAPGLSAGDGLLVVPAGNSLSVYTLSTNP